MQRNNGTRIFVSEDVQRLSVRVLRLFGMKPVSPNEMTVSVADRMSKTGTGAWASDQIRFRKAMLAFRDSEAARATRAPWIARFLGLSDEDYIAALSQTVCDTFLYPNNSMRLLNVLIPDMRFAHGTPKDLSVELEAAGVTPHFNEGSWNTSFIDAWSRRITGALVCLAHGLQSFLDEVRPCRPLTSESITIWPSDGTSRTSETEGDADIRKFAKEMTNWLHPKTDHVFEVETGPLWRLRRKASIDLVGALRTFSLSLMMSVSVLFGDWRTALMARQLAVLPRAAAMLRRMRPVEAVISLSWIPVLPLWLRLARRNGCRVTIACYSTQIWEPQTATDHVPNVILDIYMLAEADRFLVWDEVHKRDLMDCALDPTKIEIVGPVIFSDRPKRAKTDRSGPVVIDFFDQPPDAPFRSIRLGVPGFYSNSVRTETALRDVVATVEELFERDDVIIRLKLKRELVTTYTTEPYAKLIQELEAAKRIIVLSPERSPLHMHAEADLTIGFPFVSPVVSADWMGCPSAFYDPTGDVFVEKDQARHIPVLRGKQSLGNWVKQELAKLETAQ